MQTWRLKTVNQVEITMETLETEFEEGVSIKGEEVMDGLMEK